jgi:pimeloyl-ACP methyl ester carboxylesterase
MKTIFIHGATASERSFAYIQQEIKIKNPIFLNYEKEDKAIVNLENMCNTLDKKDTYVIVAHSLGGVYATYLQERFNINGVVSLATPFNGSEIATWGSMLNPSYQLFRDIKPSSDFIRYSRLIPITIPWMQIVTTTGDVPWLAGKNDGIVTKQSMMCRNDIEYDYIDRNHYEVVLSKRVVDIIKKRVYK